MPTRFQSRLPAVVKAATALYTFKQRLDPGDWRVDVETEDGRVVGRVSVVVARGEKQGRHPERSCTNPMKRLSGLKLLEEREGEGRLRTKA